MSHPDYAKIGPPVMWIIEECGEILQAVGKGERFGWRNHHPDIPNTDNLLALENEICDLLEAVSDLKSNVQQKDATDESLAVCLDCGFEYDSINCIGCEHYRR